ncbi:uncharacterized protein BDZ83DRAFT_608282 [Colletotrichum acutatum]|uniref:Uncharacterized protein n=1 Tax=Glomerella acutata TaxID=27357 RepID=A0AAD8XK34_GLOAC|nr:uncharacterized protein BDZ83DRAFT_608282 [Colletotrichum acutatum]KAK1728817.1 hypothetical protein BDZ83DRAFT_608282 [Colletotrichum acutatum]
MSLLRIIALRLKHFQKGLASLHEASSSPSRRHQAAIVSIPYAEEPSLNPQEKNHSRPGTVNPGFSSTQDPTIPTAYPPRPHPIWSSPFNPKSQKTHRGREM